MDKNIERILQSPILKLASENQARLDSLSYATGSIADLSKVVRNLDPAKRWAGHAMTQDLLSQLTQNFAQNNLAISNDTLEMAKSLAELSNSNTSFFESIKINTALIDALEATHLGLKPATQIILPEGFASNNQIGDLSSVITKATEVFKQYEQFGDLESFKAISRLKNFPFEDILLTDFTDSPVIDNSNDKTIVEIDAEISDELSAAKSFNDLSEKSQNSLLNLYQNYYSPTLFSYLTIVILISALINSDDIFLTLNLSPLPDYLKIITLYLYQKIIEPFAVSYSAAHFYSVNQVKKSLKEVKTKSNVKSFTRKSHTSFDRSLLKGYRVTISESLELKASPNIDALVIDTLPIGTLLEVLDKSNRSWLLVEIKIDGELDQGWVLRRYTTYFK